jgi:hypothetical protein
MDREYKDTYDLFCCFCILIGSLSEIDTAGATRTKPSIT